MQGDVHCLMQRFCIPGLGMKPYFNSSKIASEALQNPSQDMRRNTLIAPDQQVWQERVKVAGSYDPGPTDMRTAITQVIYGPKAGEAGKHGWR